MPPETPPKDSKPTEATASEVLRSDAEARLRARPGETSSRSGESGEQILHELRVHQIELEMQNEELRRTQEALEEAHARYFELFELAPVAYLTLDGEGVILEANLTFSQFLGLPRAALLNQPIARLIAWESQDDYYIQKRKLAETGEPQTCEIRLKHAHGHFIWLQSSTTQYQNRDGTKFTRMTLTDICDRKQAKLVSQREAEERRKSEQQRAAILNSLPANVALLDMDGRIVAVNKGWRAFGQSNGLLSTDACVGADYLCICDLVTGEDMPEAKAAAKGIRSVLRGKAKRFSLEYPCHSPSEKRWFNLVVTPLPLGELTGAVVTHVDVTDHKLAEEAIRKSEERYRSLLENIPQNIMIKDRESRYVAINEYYARSLGIPSASIIGKTDFDFAPKELAEKYRRDDMRIMERGKQEEFDEKFFQNGKLLWIHTVKVPLRDPQGEITGILVVFWENTERKLAEEKLHLQAAVLEAVANAIVITDTQGIIEWVNPAFTECTGYSPEEAIGKNPRKLVKSGTQDEAFYRQMWETIQAGMVWRGELVNRRKDGTLYTEEQTITPVRDDTGAIRHFVGVKLDITNRKKLELELYQAQKMESVGRLAGGVAHDFNNLLTVISGYTELALASDELEVGLQADLAQVYKAAERAASLTRQLLAFSRRQVLRPELVDLNHVVADCTKMLQRLIGEDIAFVVKPGVGLWGVLADPGQIEQIIMNLVVNSRDAMPTGGTVVVETGNFSAEDHLSVRHLDMEPGEYVCLAVSDNGTGMDEATRAMVFEPFFTTKEVGRGTGLGLATVYGIVKQSGGSIYVYSELGKGTTFKIYLPRVVEAGPAPSNIGDKRALLSGTETILLVEDEEPLRLLTERILMQAGYTVLSAGNGADALKLVEQQDNVIHLVLTDVIMPGISGRELVDRLHEKHPDYRILYMSGYTDTAIAAHGVLEAGTQLLGKPFTAIHLTQKVREVLDL